MKLRLLAVVITVCLIAPVFAQDEVMAAMPMGPVANLESGFPTQIVDTTVTPVSKWEAGAALGYVTDGITYEVGLLQVNYGVMEDLQASVKWPLILGEAKVVGNGDTTLAALWAPVKEQDWMPSMGLQLAVKTPTGEGYTGYDGTLTGVATKQFGDIRAHLNASYTTIGDNAFNKAHTDAFALGADYMVLDNMCLVGDIVSTEAPVGGIDRVDTLEVGARYALTDIDIISAGIGLGIGNGNATPDFTAVVGYQREL